MIDIRVEDFFGKTFSLPLKAYAGVDYSKKCFIFPGQGVAVPAIASAELKKFEILQKRFQIADALAQKDGIPAPSLFIEDYIAIPQEDFSLVRSLAFFTLSVGLFEVMISLGERPSLLTAHSFGEYAAFVAAGILTFEEAFKIVLAREKFCEPADSVGKLIAVSAGEKELRSIAGLNQASLANFNSPRQTVLAVSNSHLKATLSVLKKNKFAAKVLETVPQPYHSALMNAPAEKMAGFLEEHRFDFRPPRIPILSSVTGEVLDRRNFSVNQAKSVLSRQLVSPVQFISQIRKASDLGFQHFVEVSVSRIAQAWIADSLEGQPYRVSFPKAMAPDISAVKKEKRRDHDSKLVGLLNRVVASVTGYSVSEISLSNNFQEDLGIDSIKKAQIVLNFLESQGEFGGLQDGILMNQIRTLEDVLNWYATPKKKKEGQSSFELYQTEWVLKPISKIDFAPLSPRIEWLSLSKPEEFSKSLSDCNALVMFDDKKEFDFDLWLKSVQANYDQLKKLPSDFIFVLVTSESSSAEVRGFEGFLRSLAKELGCDFTCIQIEEFSESRDMQIILQELSLPQLEKVKYSANQRYIQKFAKLAEPGTRRHYESVLAIGGGSGVTFELLKSMIIQGTKKILVMGRRSESQSAAAIAELCSLGADVQYFAGDATNKQNLEEALRVHGSVDLVIHGGGNEHSAIISLQKSDDVRSQIQIKVQTLRHLKELARQMKFRVVAFSSTAGEFGNQGQAIYAYANQVMTAECVQAVKEGLPFSTLAWPAWENLGMTAKEEIAQQLRLAGTPLLAKSKGIDIFSKFLDLAGEHRAICLDGETADMFLPRVQAVQTVLPAASHLHFPVLLEHWTLRDLPALHDHIIMKQSLVPVAFAISFLWHMHVLRTGRSGKLQNIEAKSFMLLHRRDSPYILDYQSEVDADVYEIRANRPMLRARMVKPKPDDYLAPAYRESGKQKNVDMFKQAYATMGKRLHLLEDVRISDDGTAYARLNLSRHSLYPASTSLNRQLVLLEGMFQLSGSDAEARHGKVGVPVSIDSFVVNDRANTGLNFTLMAKCKYDGQDSAEADIYAYNESAEIFLIVKREKLRLFFGEPVVSKQ